MAKSLQNTRNYWVLLQKIALLVILCAIIFSLPLCIGDNHEKHPSFKYSREANENVNVKEFVHRDHDHHDHDHGHHHHDHDHGHHLHDHDHHHHDHDHSDHDHDHNHHQHHDDIDEEEDEVYYYDKASQKLDMSTIWIHSIASTLVISAAPFVLLYIIPLDNSEAMRPRLKVLLSFASGGLLGDAFLHLIPHAAQPHSHHGHDDHHHHHHDGHSHSHDMSVGLWVLGGIIAFLSVEKLVRLLKGDNHHGHGHSHGKPQQQTNKTNNKEQVNTKQKTDKNDKTVKKSTKVKVEKASEVEISGYLNLVADFTHNFTDGLAIGASYLAGEGVGLITTITILLHEVPHEIGDYAILIKSGCSPKKAILLQLVTAVGALAGTALALLGAGGSHNSWILPFTAGGFIYIATVSVLPELLEGSTKLGQSIKEILALLAGVLLMVFIAAFE